MAAWDHGLESTQPTRRPTLVCLPFLNPRLSSYYKLSRSRSHACFTHLPTIFRFLLPSFSLHKRPILQKEENRKRTAKNEAGPLLSLSSQVHFSSACFRRRFIYVTSSATFRKLHLVGCKGSSTKREATTSPRGSSFFLPNLSLSLSLSRNVKFLASGVGTFFVVL